MSIAGHKPFSYNGYQYKPVVFEYIAQLPEGEQVILNALDEQEPLSINQLAHRFGVEDMLYETKDTAFMASLLYYIWCADIERYDIIR